MRRPPRFRPTRGGSADDVKDRVEETLNGPYVNRLLRGEADGTNVRVVVFDTWPVGGAGDPALGKIIGYRTKFDGTIDDRHLTEAEGGTLLSRANFRDHVDGWPGYPVSPIDCEADPLYEYDQSDHGLFIAGIIKDIAPGAELFVRRVMPDRGCGDLYDVAEAMSQAISDLSVGPDASKPVIFNLSWGVGPDPHLIRTVMEHLEAVYSYDGAKVIREMRRARYAAMREGVAPEEIGNFSDSAHLGEELVRRKVEMLIADGVATWDDIPEEERAPGGPSRRLVMDGEARLIEVLTEILRRRNVLLVAAAGNDACEGEPRPEPRMPAKFEGVLGVSAVDDIRTPTLTPYSNLDDSLLPDDGIGAVGGGTTGTKSAQGLVSLFVSEKVPRRAVATDPTDPDNRKGLVLWSGTSFATPVAVGFAACLWSEMYSLNTYGERVFDSAETVLTAIVKDPRGGERLVVPLEQKGWRA